MAVFIFLHTEESGIERPIPLLQARPSLAVPLLAVSSMAALFLAATSVFGAETGAEDIDGLEMAKGLFGGLALLDDPAR